MDVVGLGVERLDLDIRLAFFDVACRAGLNDLPSAAVTEAPVSATGFDCQA